MAGRQFGVALLVMILLLIGGREIFALPIRTTDPNVGIFSGTVAVPEKIPTFFSAVSLPRGGSLLGTLLQQLFLGAAWLRRPSMPFLG